MVKLAKTQSRLVSMENSITQKKINAEHVFPLLPYIATLSSLLPAETSIIVKTNKSHVITNHVFQIVPFISDNLDTLFCYPELYSRVLFLSRSRPLAAPSGIPAEKNFHSLSSRIDIRTWRGGTTPYSMKITWHSLGTC